MTVMTPAAVVDILGKCFGDQKWHYPEEIYPPLTIADSNWTSNKIAKYVQVFLEYGLLRGRTDGKFRGYSEYQLTEKGALALDHYRDLHYKSLSRDPDKFKVA